MLVYLRRRKVERRPWKQNGNDGHEGLCRHCIQFQTFQCGHRRLGQIGQKAVVRNNGISLKLGPLKGWNNYRVAPSLAKKSFRQQWNKLDQELNQEQPAMDSSVRSRMEQIIRQREEGRG